MIIYRPHRGGLKEAMEEVKEFSSREEMLVYIVESHTDSEWGPAFTAEDLVIGEEVRDDPRIGWHDTRYVCTKSYHGKVYDPPVPIGHCATDYEK